MFGIAALLISIAFGLIGMTDKYIPEKVKPLADRLAFPSALIFFITGAIALGINLHESYELQVPFRGWAFQSPVRAKASPSESASAEQPTFPQSTDIVTLSLGSNDCIVKATDLRAHPIRAFGEGGVYAISGLSPISFAIRDNRLVVTTKLYAGDNQPPIEILDNVLENSPPSWDYSSNQRALEYVDANQQPVFQLIYKTAQHVVLTGSFVLTNDGRFVATDEEVSINDPNAPALRPIFKHPAWKYPHQYAAP